MLEKQKKVAMWNCGVKKLLHVVKSFIMQGIAYLRMSPSLNQNKKIFKREKCKQKSIKLHY